MQSINPVRRTMTQENKSVDDAFDCHRNQMGYKNEGESCLVMGHQRPLHLFLICGKHMQERKSSQGRDTKAHKTSLIPSLLIEMPILSQESERSCMYLCVRGINFGIIPTVWYLFVCFFFHFIAG